MQKWKIELQASRSRSPSANDFALHDEESRLLCARKLRLNPRLKSGFVSINKRGKS